MAGSSVHPDTLFHLVPLNNHDVLDHPDNKRFVSESKDGQRGLEIGFHVPTTPNGRVITRLGRNADLILSKSSLQKVMSRIHVAFELHPTTHLIILSVRSRTAASTSVTFRELESAEAATPITGNGVIVYNADHAVSVASYEFKLVWRTLSDDMRQNTELLKKLALQGHSACRQRMLCVRSRDRPSEADTTEALSWHVTRLNTAKKCQVFEEVKQLRERLTGEKNAGEGAYGIVYRAFDKTSGHAFAIKVVKLKGNPVEKETSRALLHREIKHLERMDHPHIIKYLGSQALDTDEPEIFMPLCHGSLASLTMQVNLASDRVKICTDVGEQILSALDYLDCKKMIHRDVKPENILFTRLPENEFIFQLADFGLANHRSLSRTICGTGFYMSPELFPHYATGISAPQSSKMDIWSLGATLLAVLSQFTTFPPNLPPDRDTVHAIIEAVQTQATNKRLVWPMTRMHPDQRASAAQLLVTFYEGRGLVSERSKVPTLVQPPSEPDATVGTAPVPPWQQPPPPAKREHRAEPRTRPRRAGAELPLVVWPHPPRVGGTKRGAVVPAQLPQPTRARRNGVAKRRAEVPASDTKRAEALFAAVGRLAQPGEPSNQIPGAFPNS